MEVAADRLATALRSIVFRSEWVLASFCLPQPLAEAEAISRRNSQFVPSQQRILVYLRSEAQFEFNLHASAEHKKALRRRQMIAPLEVERRRDKLSEQDAAAHSKFVRMQLATLDRRIPCRSERVLCALRRANLHAGDTCINHRMCPFCLDGAMQRQRNTCSVRGFSFFRSPPAACRWRCINDLTSRRCWRNAFAGHF